MAITTNWTSPASATLDKSTGGTLDEAFTDAVASNFYNKGGTAGYIGALGAHSANQSIANDTNTVVALNSETHDSDPNGAIHDTAANNSRLTVRTAGLYLVCGGVQFAANATGYRDVFVQLNGATTIGMVRVPAVAGVVQLTQVFAVRVLAASDYVELWVRQTSGGALNVEFANSTPWLALTKL
jgi:hypothetical protein